MAREEDGGKLQLSRRDFLKVSGAAAAAGVAGVELAFAPSMAAAADVAATYHTTCPYCSASCGQLVDVDASGNVLDIYGDPESPINQGGLCAKGAGAHQLVTNKYRLGAWSTTHPVDDAFKYNASYASGVAYKRIGNGAWSQMDLSAAFTEIVEGSAGEHLGLIGADSSGGYRGAVTAANGYMSKGVAFLGSSHINNEANNLYRKVIANFGTNNTEHQARI